MNINELKYKVIKELNRALEKLLKRLNRESVSVPSIPSIPSVPSNTDSVEDQVDFKLLNFTYGGVSGGSAKLSPKARIKNLKCDNSNMSYAWQSGGCEDLGAGGGHDHTKTSACLFIKNAQGNWVGGRFDAISTDRLTRGFKNITGEQYRRWNRNEFYASKDVCFCIVADNGSVRTNVIKASK